MKSMHFVVLLLAIALSACSGPAPVAVPTETPTAIPPSPTSTPIPPTPTVVPTATATPLPAGWPVAALKIVSSLPMTGDSANAGQAVSNAMQLRLDQASGQACGGKYTVAYEAWDDASTALGRWDPGVERQNAKAAVDDKSIVAYLGPYNSGAAKVSIPILSVAGVVMVSPSNTMPGLTRPPKGASSRPNYARVIAADDVQGTVDASFMFNKLGVKNVYILDDRQDSGKAIANAFDAAARSLGMKVLGRQSIEPKAADYVALMTRISTSNNGGAPDAIFAAISIDTNAANVLSDKVDVMGSNTVVKFMGPEGILTEALIGRAGGNVSDGVFASFNGRPFPDGLTEAGKQFMTDYELKYGPLSEPYAIHGYESMSVLLKSIDDICAAEGDPTVRKQVRDAVFATKDFNGVLGTWSFDKSGETTLTDTTIYQVRNGQYEVAEIYK